MESPDEPSATPGSAGLKTAEPGAGVLLRGLQIVVLALAGTGIAVPVQAQVVAFVSNTGQTSVAAGYYTDTQQRAQQFATGRHAAGYTLSEVVVDIGRSCSIPPAFALHTSTTDGKMLEVPGNKVVDLIGSAASLGSQSFAPASATTLASSTKYFIVFKTSAVASVTDCKVHRTLSTNVDPGAAPGWDIARNAVFSYDSGSTWTTTHSMPEDPRPPVKIAIRGVVEPSSSGVVKPSSSGVVKPSNSAPGRPRNLTATAGDQEVVLAWSAPGDDGGTPVTGYEYRYGPGDAVPGETPWREAGADGELAATVTGLENETRYAFEVWARNQVGSGEASRATALPLRLRAELFSSQAAAEGEALTLGVRRSGGVAFPAHTIIGVTDNAFPGVSAGEEGRSDGLGRHRLEFAAGEAEVTVTVTVAFDGERRQDRVLTATLDSAATEVDNVRRPYEPVAPELAVSVTEGDAGLSVADVRVQGESAVLAFTVSMDRTRDVAVQVDYATENGSARAEEDYTPVTGTLTIAPGGREGTVEVPVLPALHVTAARTLTLRLSNARNAVIEDGVAMGTIVRESELPKAWLARFGRTASDHAAQAIARRLESGGRETHVTVAGRRLDGLVGGLRSGGGGDLLGSTARKMASRATSGLASAAPSAQHGGDPGAESLRSAVLPRLPELHDALLGSSFHVEGGAQQAEGGGRGWAAWGDVTTTHFEGDAGGLGLDGDVTTGTVGLDRQWRRLLLGLALARSTGEGDYGGGAGTITSTLTSVHPYLRLRLAERAQLWGAMSWGRGILGLTPGSGAAIETDLDNSMAVVGGRAVLRAAGATGSSFELALRSDMLWTSTSSAEAGVLAEATGGASRGRVMLEGTGRIQGLGGVLHPSVEGGLRHDDGDAETGTGFEVGGGLDWIRGGLALRLNGRMLLAYADESYEEWGYGGSLVYQPGTDGRGLQMRLGLSTGATASGVQSLWRLENAAGLARQAAMPFARRSDGEIGFGMGEELLWYPYLAADATGQKRLGLRLSSGQSLDIGLELGRMHDGTQPAKNALILRGNVRF